MARSKWKLPFFHRSLLYLGSKSVSYKIAARNSTILPICVGYKFLIYNGHLFKEVLIQPEMVGRKFGEFAFTRLVGSGAKIHERRKKGRK